MTATTNVEARKFFTENDIASFFLDDTKEVTVKEQTFRNVSAEDITAPNRDISINVGIIPSALLVN